MIRCCLCAVWFHEECVGIKSADDSGGLWPCGECRTTGTRLKSLVETVTQLVAAIADIGRQLTASEKARQDERAAAAAESASLLKENETLRCNVAAVNEKLTTLMWKTFRPPSQPSSLLIGSSLIKGVNKDGLQDTDVVCIPGAKIDDVRDRLEALPSDYDKITLLVGGNDCDVTPPPPAATIVTKYGGLLDMAQAKARAVTVSSICPRKTTDDTRMTIEAVNAGLVSLCEEKAATFADNTPSFTLSDGSINDGYLMPDGVHVTRTAIDRIVKNLGLPVKDPTRGVTSSQQRPRQSQPARTERRRPRKQEDDDEGWQTVRHSHRTNTPPPRNTARGNSYCYFCGESGHVKDNCRHGHRVECHACGGLGHKAKLCTR